MNRKAFALALTPLLFFASFLAMPKMTAPAHAALIGVVCIAADGSNSCPANPPVLTGPVPPPTPPPPQLRVAVVIQGSDGINGFDITLNADHTILKPVNVSITGTVLPGSISILVECIGGVFIQGSGGCSPSTDTIDTIHFAVVAGITSTPVTGLLFTGIYNITQATSITPLAFQTGCTGTSVSGGVCVKISNGTTVPDPEISQTGGFSNLAYFAMDANPPTLTISKGFSDISTITLTSLNNFAGNVALTPSVSPAGPTPSLAPYTSVILTTGGANSTTLTVDVAPSVAPGNYTVTVIGTNGTLTNSVKVFLTVPIPDFTITASPSTIAVNASASGKTTITLTSLGAFAGTITLTTSPSSGLTASIKPASLTLSAQGTAQSTLSVSAPIQASYKVNVTAVSGSISHLITVNVNVLDFSITASPDTLTISQGTSKTTTITVTGLPPTIGGFTGNVTIEASATTTGLTASCSPTSLILTSNVRSLASSCSFSSSTIGNYTVVVAGTSGSLFHATIVQVQVTGPDFRVDASPLTQALQPGSSFNSTITLTGLAGFSGDVTLSTTVAPAGPVASLSLARVSLTPTADTGTSTLRVTVASTIAPGTYVVTVKGTSGTLSRTVNVNVIVVASTVLHDVAVASVTLDSASGSVGAKITFSIMVQNLGTTQEQVTVAALVGDQTVATQQNVTLPANQNATVTLTWDTSGFPAGAYVVGGKVLGVPGETNTANNVQRAPVALSLNALSTSPLQQAALPLLAVAVIAAVVALVLLRPRRGSVTRTV